MRILALDPATIFGWAINKYIYGTWDLRIKKDESPGMKFIRLRAKLQELYESESIELIVFERPGGRFKNDIISHSKFQAIIEEFCAEKKIEQKGYSSKEIKKFATGIGNANKLRMIEAAKEKLEYQGNNDNEADALWILYFAIDDLKL